MMPHEPTQERDRRHHERGAAIGPRPLELVRDAAVVSPREAVLRERGPRAVAAQALEGGTVVLGDDDTGVQREALRPRAQALGAAHGRPTVDRRSPGRRRLRLDPWLVTGRGLRESREL